MAHEHQHNISNINRAFVIGIVINAFYVIIEFGAGLYYDSLSLMSDAGHNLSDVAALAMALLAFRLMKVKASEKFTYGYRKSTILVSLVNSVVLFIVIGGILWESFHRIQTRVLLDGSAISVIAAVGIVVNAVSAFLFFRDKDNDLNIRGAYLHLMADAAVSAGVVVSGLLISAFHFYWLDMAMSMVIVGVIFYSTWKLFKDSLSLTLDGVPPNVDMNVVRSEIGKISGVVGVHHLHVWAMSTTQNALTAHVLVKYDTGMQQLNQIKKDIKLELNHLNIQHATLEFETEEENCIDLKKK